ncbi:MAG: FAD-dependent oxidoreductase [Minisyncoccales bacterium]
MKKLVIVGGGVSGLTAAYTAGKKNMDAVLLEKSSLPGGRLEYCLSFTSSRFQPQLYKLIEELDLKELTTSFPPSLLGMYVKGNVVPYSELPNMIKKMPKDQQKVINKIMGEAMKSNFNIDNPSENLKKLRNIPFDEYIKDCSPQTIKMFIEPMMTFTFLEEIDMSKFSAEYGLFNIRFGLEMGEDDVFTFDEGVRIIADILQKKAQEKGVTIRTDSKVTKIKKENNHFKIHYDKIDGEKVIEAENVIVSTPLRVTKKIFPEINIPEGASYNKTKCYLLEGEPKEDKQAILGMPGNKANLRFLFSGPYGTHYVYPMKNDKPVDFDAFYKNYEITTEEIIENPFVVIKAGTDLSKIKTNIENAYICGDYYYYPLIETSISTAQKAVEMIN